MSSFCLLYIAVLVGNFYSQVYGQEASWPRADQIGGFWPLSNYYKLRDVSGNALDGATMSGSSPTTAAGPFGDPNTSYMSSTVASGGIMQVTSSKAAAKLSLNGLDSFTLSFFLRHPSGSGQFLQYLNADGSLTTNPFSIYISNNDIRVYGAGVLNALFPNVLSPYIWNYVALTFVANGKGQQANCSFTLYNRFGRVTNPRVFTNACSAMASSAGGLRIGYGQYSSTWSTNLAVACLMMYRTALTEEEVIQNYESCRSVLVGAQCGTPRLPLSQVPQVPVIPARAGQFPWIASLLYQNTIVCSATIISPFWLVTAVSCLTDSSIATEYFIRAGEFDSALSESHELRIQVRNIFYNKKPYTTFYDIALIELASAIDFGNSNYGVYANEACILSNDSMIPLNGPSFVIGWGENGRNSLASKTTIRYAPGSIPTNGSCSTSWTEKPKVNAEPLLCFVGQPDSTVPCNGDGGSPLAVVVNSKLVQVGIYSRRNANCTNVKSEQPLFTRVSNFWPWIKSTIACINPGLIYPRDCPMP